MNSGSKKNILVIGLVLILIGCVAAPVFALLLHNTNIDFEVDFGEIPANSTEFTAVSSQSFLFTRAGDIKDIDLMVKNNSINPLNYRYEITLDGESSGLEMAVFTYFDGQYLGVLGEIVAGGKKFITDNDYLIVGKRGDAVDINNHRLSFELHNAATGSIFDGKECKIKITLMANSINYQEEIIVASAEEFNMAIDDVNAADNIKTIRIATGVTLNKDLILTNSCRIDLMGNKIRFNHHTLSIKNPIDASVNGICRIALGSSQGAANRDNGDIDAIILDGDKVALDIEDNAATYSRIVKVRACDTVLGYEIVTNAMRRKIGRGIPSSTPVNVMGGAAFYIDNNALGDINNIVPGDAGYTYSDGVITPEPIDKSRVSYMLLGGKKVDIKLLGKNDSYNSIIDNELRHLINLTMDNNSSEVDFNLFLPKYLPRINANIEWWSDNTAIMSNDGICGDTVEGAVTLLANIRINNDIITREFTFSVLKQNNQMRFDYLVARIGEQRLSALYDVSQPDGSQVTLPIVSDGNASDYRIMYEMRSIGLESLTYELSPTFTYLSLAGNVVMYMDYTLDRYAEVRIKGVFSNEQSIEYSSSIGIVIETVDNEKLHEEIFQYLQAELNKVNVLQIILDTRAEVGMQSENGNFYMPTNYRGYNITYSSLDPIISSIELITIPNSDEQKYLIKLDLTKLLAKQSNVELIAILRIDSWATNGLTPERAVTFNAPAAIHYYSAEDISKMPTATSMELIGSSDLFYSTRLQVIQQIRDKDGNLESGVLDIDKNIDNNSLTLNDTYMLALEKNYILMRDIAYAKQFNLVSGNKNYGDSNKAIAIGGEGLYYYNVNSLNVDYDGLKHMGNLTRLSVNGKSATLFPNVSAMDVSDVAVSFLNFCVANYKALTSVDFIACHIKSGNELVKLTNLTRINLSDNSELKDFEWVTFLQGSNLEFLNISGTAFDTLNDIGILTAWYYRYGIAHNASPTYYYGDNILYMQTLSDEEMRLTFYLYTIDAPKKIIDTPFLQLKDITSGFKIEWGVIAPIIVADGKEIKVAELKINLGSSKASMQNNIYGIVAPSGRPPMEEVILTATIGTVTRNITLWLKYNAQ